MSRKSNDQGRAYEFAWIKTLEEELSKQRTVRIIHNSSFDANKKAWDNIDSNTQHTYITSAKAAVGALLELEPCLQETQENDADLLTLAFLKDEYGTQGDVRDIQIKRDCLEWEIGLSIKHNHHAVKHSRLSHRLDFGKEWFHAPCSDSYWQEIEPIFNQLKAAKAKGEKWNTLSNKEEDIYLPLLHAFMNEINRVNQLEDDIPKKMVEYLIGIHDYHKIVSKDAQRITLIQSFNMSGTLNKPSKTKISAITVPIVKLPTRLVALQLKPESKTTVEMYLNNGWALSFRIHNASTKVEPSLKFDIQFMGMPPSIFTIHCSWK